MIDGFVKGAVPVLCASIFGIALAKKDYYIAVLSAIAWVLMIADLCVCGVMR